MKKLNGTDGTLEALVAAHRRGVESDPRWRALTSGALSAQEAAALRREAPDLYELYRPFDADEKARLFAHVAHVARVLPRQAGEARVSRRQRWALRAAPILAAAALVAIHLSTRSPALELAWSEQRGGDIASPHLSSAPEAKLTEIIVPVHPVDGTIVVRGALLVRPGSAEPGRVRPWNLVARPTSSDNTIVLTGTRRELFPGVPSGEWDLYVAAGRPGAPLSEREMLGPSSAPAGGLGVSPIVTGDYQILKKRVVLEGECVGTPAQPCREETP